MKNRYWFTKEDQIKGGKLSKATKTLTSQQMKNYYQLEREILYSQKNNKNTIFCNRVIDGFKFEDNKLTIIEIKVNSGTLNKNQKKFRDLLENVGKVEFELIHRNHIL